MKCTHRCRSKHYIVQALTNTVLVHTQFTCTSTSTLYICIQYYRNTITLITHKCPRTCTCIGLYLILYNSPYWLHDIISLLWRITLCLWNVKLIHSPLCIGEHWFIARIVDIISTFRTLPAVL